MMDAERQTIRKMQSILLSIQNGKPRFFNIVQYENLGLVYSTENHGKDATGNDIIINHKWHLTEKGKQLLTVII